MAKVPLLECNAAGLCRVPSMPLSVAAACVATAAHTAIARTAATFAWTHAAAAISA